MQPADEELLNLGNVISDTGLGVLMVVKSVRGRRRYVYVRVPAGMHRDRLEEALAGRVPSMKVITCYRGNAVVRFSPADWEAIGSVAESEGFETVKVSGTLRTLRDEYPCLRVPQKRKR